MLRPNRSYFRTIIMYRLCASTRRPNDAAHEPRWEWCICYGNSCVRYIQFILVCLIHFSLSFGSGTGALIRGFHLWIIDELFELMSNRFDSRLISLLNIHDVVHVCSASEPPKKRYFDSGSVVSMFRNLSAGQSMFLSFHPFAGM